MQVKQCESRAEWDKAVLASAGHPLQLWGWGEVKASGNWRVERVFVCEDDETIGMAQLLLRPLPGPFKSLAYVPRGPVASTDKREVVLRELAIYVKSRHGSVSLLVEPDWEEMPIIKGWHNAPNPILMARTLILDLAKPEDELLAAMSKKTRQYIRKSAGGGVEVRMATAVEDVAACLAIYKQTAARAGFALHDDHYYEDIFHQLGDHCKIFMATYEGRVVAFVWLAVSEEVAFELYGGMNDEGQRLRANYTLKWEAIRRTKEWGVRRYDMNGLLNDGVSTFKQGFASHEDILAGSYEVPLSPLYTVWARGLPAVKKLVRFVKK